MKKSIDNYEEIDDQVEEIIMSALELADFIEERIAVRGRKSKANIKEINGLIDEYNNRFGHTYTRLREK